MTHEELTRAGEEPAGASHPSPQPNRLIHEKSPYLLQHAYNPVDWRPWGHEAFEEARKADKPVFVSIGYSTCHWCHVMERESFEDHEVAALMNDAFVSVKVDREERPDVDHTYMTVCQMLTGSGGWPLNVVMTPDKKPFFAGTYFPKETRMGRLGLMDLTSRIKEIWTQRRDEVLQSADKVVQALRDSADDSPGEVPGFDTLNAAFEQLVQRFDANHGGFSAAPKFPTPHNMLFLLRYWKRTGDAKALDMVEKTLRAMRLGGVYDHVGYGFHRYSTDAYWLVPHFEKMLYDQAMLVMTYVEAFQATGKEEYRRTAEQTVDYVLRDMTSPEGAFYSAEDADSEGVEGKFYVWTLDELEQVLDRDDTDLVRRVFNVRPGGNYREEATGEATGTNILHLTEPLDQIAPRMGLEVAELERRVEDIRFRLFQRREKRIRPHRDDKILTDWNGLMIAAMAKAAQAFDRPDYAEAASRAADFILGRLNGPYGAIMHRFRDGHAGIIGKADDYAFLTWGLLELYEATLSVAYLERAVLLSQYLEIAFWDGETGGFFFTSNSDDDLPVRKKEIYDGATPSGNAVAALNLLRLGRMTATPEQEKMAERLFAAFSGALQQFPSAYTQFMVALEFALAQGKEVVIVGAPDSEDTRRLLKEVRQRFLPDKVLLFRSVHTTQPDIVTLAEYTRDQTAVDGKATAYVCVNHSCGLPVTEPESMLAALGAT